MAETLLIHYNFSQPDHAVWSQVNATGELTTKISHGSVNDAAEMAASCNKVVVLLDSSCLHFNTILLPTQNRQKMLRAVPYALEEQIAEDVDDFHFAIDKPGHDGKLPVVGIMRATLEHILKVFTDANIFVDAILPDALCLTADEQQWAILYFENKAYIQFDSLYAGLFDRDLALVLLKSAVEKHIDHLPTRTIIFTTENDTGENLSNVLPDTIELINVNYNAHPIVVFCGQYIHAMPLNLLQDKYKPQRKSTMRWGKWGLPASLAALWLVLHLSVISLQYFDLTEKNKVLGQQITKVFKQSFPESKHPNNPRMKMEHLLNDLKGNKGGGSSSMLTLLANSASSLASDKSITIETINYRNDKVDIGLVSKNLQAIENLNKSLNTKSGLKSEITRSTSDKELVKGSIRLERSKT